MSFTFSSIEFAELKARFSQAKIDEAKGDKHSYASVYQFVANRLNLDRTSHPGTSPADLIPGVRPVALWFEGAAQVNRDDGYFSVLIREYSARQGALRYGDEQRLRMQAASNKVARNALQGLVDAKGVLPSLAEIAENDATGVGEVLFDRNEKDSAHSKRQNSAWSGAVLFSMLSGDETGRLFGTDEAFNTLSDFRDVLFAYDAFVYAYDRLSVLGDFSSDSVFAGFKTLKADFFNPIAFTDSESLLGAITSDSVAATAIDFIRASDRYALLDQLSTLLGVNPYSDTGEANFQDRASTLFKGIQARAGLTQGITLLDAQTSSQIYLKASGGSQDALAYRYALVHATPFVLNDASNVYAAHNQGGALDLYDEKTGEGHLSAAYLQDRSVYLSALMARDHADNTIVDLGDKKAVFYDVDSNVNLSTGGTSKSYSQFFQAIEGVDSYQFGSEQPDVLVGSTGADHLFGQGGDDVLFGGGE